jgi:hypothetical protein
MFKTRDFLPVIIAALIIVALAYAGLAQSDICAGNGACWVEVPFQILFGNYKLPDHPHPLLSLAQQGGRFLLLAGAFVSGVRVVVSAVRHDFRLAMARRKKQHTIVCGLGDSGMQVVSNMQATGQEVVVVDRLDNTVNAAACDQQGIPVVKGDAGNAEVLTLAGALRAQTIIVCTGNDADNMDVALSIKDLVSRRPRSGSGALTVLAEMRDPWLFSRLIDHDRQALGSADVDLRLFNIYENAARLLVRSLRLPPGPEIDAGAFVIAGFGTMGQQLLLHLIRAAPGAIGSKTKIVVLDREADQQKVRFLQSYPAVTELADVSFVGADISLDAEQVWTNVEKIVRDIPVSGVAICFSNDQDGLYAALSMRRLLDNLSRIHVPLFVRLERQRHLGQFASALANLPGPSHRLQAFGGLQELLSTDLLIRGKLDTLAAAFHTNWLNSPANDRTSSAARPWAELAETFKMSNRRRADSVPIQFAQAGLRLVPSPAPVSLKFSAEEIELLARFEHRRWSSERRLLGFTYGPVRSQNPPRHELLVEWEQLPEKVRERNRADLGTLPDILAAANFEIRRDRKILAIGPTLAAAVAELETAIAGGEKNIVVIADVDTEAGRKAAELTLKLPGSALWLVSSEYPQRLREGRPLGPIWEGAAGWVSREQLHCESAPKSTA